jgi:hypothetical protein
VGPAEILAVLTREGIPPKPGPAAPVSDHVPRAATVPPSHRTRQMERDFTNTLLKRLEEAKALEKKKKKELQKEIKKE